MMSDHEDDSSQEELQYLDFSHESEFSSNTEVTRVESKTFRDFPKDWHETI